MNDRMDARMKELINKLAAAAPEPPPFPAATSGLTMRGSRRSMSGWVLATGVAAVVVLAVTIPVLLFDGGSSDEGPVITNPPAPVDTTTTTTTEPPTTTDTTVIAGPVPTVPEPFDGLLCDLEDLVAMSLPYEGSLGHKAMPIAFFNIGSAPCNLPDAREVWGEGTGTRPVQAELGTYVPVDPDESMLVEPLGYRTMIVEVGTGCEGGAFIGPMTHTLRINLFSGDVFVPYAEDVGCTFGHSGFGTWDLTPADHVLQEAADLHNFANAWPEPFDTFDALNFASLVTLTLGPDYGRQVDGGALANRNAWSLGDLVDGDPDRYSALEALIGPEMAIEVGPTNYCAEPPRPVADELAGLYMLSLSAVNYESCLEWWGVDLFFNADQEIAGVTLHLYEP